MQVNANSMMAHANWMASNSNNVANVNTQGYEATQTTLQSGQSGNVQAVYDNTGASTDLNREMTEQISIENGNEAQTSAIKAKDEMVGSLIDLSI